MPNRALRIGDRVCIRPRAISWFTRRCASVRLHVPYTIEDIDADGRRALYLSGLGLYAWPSEVRLYDGAEERLHRRSEKMQARIEAMKEKRREKRMRKAKR